MGHKTNKCHVAYICVDGGKDCIGFKKDKTKKCWHLHSNGYDCLNQTLCAKNAIEDLKMLGFKTS